MTTSDWTQDEALLAAIRRAEQRDRTDTTLQQWQRDVVAFLSELAGLDQAARASLEVQQRLWEDNPISAVGLGRIDVSAALADAGLRDWLAAQSLATLPTAPTDRRRHFEALHQDLLQRLAAYCPRLPRLKVFRVLAALFPRDFTSITDVGKASTLVRALTGTDPGAVARQLAIHDRLAALLGPAATELDAVVTRLRLPWLLYQELQSTDTTDPISTTPARAPLVPLPAARRRKSLTRFSGGLNLLLTCLEATRDGLGADDLLDFLKSQNPRWKKSSLQTIRSGLQFELGAIEWVDNAYRPTERGLALLESGDPAELADWLLTHIVGPDHVLVQLRDGGPCPKAALVTLLQQANPGWTVDFGPSSMLIWLRDLGVIDMTDSQRVRLTTDGQRWAEQVHWTPEALAPDIDLPPIDPDPKTTPAWANLPPEAEVLAAVATAGHFPPGLIARLHGGLWAHRRRHFAVLTGLSGSGKTLLGCAYGRALHPNDPVRQAANLQVIAVQPGWYDPTSLLGYLNPLRGDSYQRTAFLDFLMRASEAPEQPFVAVLDEMNLSHPEQYLAPLLSAMESGEALALHQEAEPVDGVPATLPYPANLALIGTVNMDETTHGLSDKVLDRAFTIEFWDIDLADYPHWGARALDAATEARARALLADLMGALRPARLHFGWRVVDDVLDFLAHCQGSAVVAVDEALDQVIYAKVLPKLRGDDSPRFRTALIACQQALSVHGCPCAGAKIADLLLDLEQMGSARFWR